MTDKLTPERLAQIWANASQMRDVLGERKSGAEVDLLDLLYAYSTQAQELAAARASYTELDHRNDELAFYNAAAFRQAEELRGALAEAREEFLACAQYDALMEGPVFKGWNRSALDRLRRKYEAQAKKLVEIQGCEAGEDLCRRLRAALERIAESRDAGRHDGLREPYPAHSDHEMWGWANEALAAIEEEKKG